jgi:alkylation response protein AidB-like acyl-CoA dehydrogenase
MPDLAELSELPEPSELPDFSELHDELRSVARDVLGRTEAGTPVGRRLLADCGWLGLEVPERLDGAGAGFPETAVILGELGRAAADSPYLGAGVLGVGALNLLAPNPGRDELLRRTASGQALPALGVSGEALSGEAHTDHRTPAFRLERTAGVLRLSGAADFVPDAAEADHLLLPAQDPDGVPMIAAVRAATAGLSVTAHPLLDAGRRLAVVSADGVAVAEDALWRFAAADPASAVRRLLDRAATAIACDSLGLSEAMLDATVAYARTREQFGRPIGSFQAVQHACADMLVSISVARRLVSTAARALSADDPAASRTAASMAKSYTCAAAVDIAGKAMQLHGGMGYTWESGIHRYLKRAILNRSLFGSPADHRRSLAQRYR